HTCILVSKVRSLRDFQGVSRARRPDCQVIDKIWLAGCGGERSFQGVSVSADRLVAEPAADRR
ncbi:hypothetical protein, partial [Mycolicibacterium phlei]|uniref:hypothetical protein n=1 Tax=Mycolicibacterium phlei TaxID=1771 RepID=UPI001A7E0830